jgi:poly-gamma-glutamate synthesis protein (capsule biosynthesis protein)
MLARGIGRQAAAAPGLDSLFAEARAMLRAPDLTFANLESVAANAGTPMRKPINFRAHPNALFALADAGFDVVSVANNHASDYGEAAAGESLERLRRFGIEVTGAPVRGATWGGPTLLWANGVSVAFLAFSEFKFSANHLVDDPAGVSILAAQVADAARRADLVVVSFHFGREYEGEPTTRQRLLARVAVDAGADLVLGHHPHQLQGVEIYRGRAIAYSLRNFLFDQPWEYTRETLLLDWRARPGGEQELRLHPMRIERTPWSPRPLLGAEAAPALEALRQAAQGLGTQSVIDGPWLRLEGLAPLTRP